MTSDERRALAEQLNANPLFHEILDAMEAQAVEACLAEGATDEQRARAAFYARASRSFRKDCMALLRNDRPRKPAPA